MRIVILFSLSILFCGFIIPKYCNNEKGTAYIYLTSGYTNDTVSLMVDTVQVLKDAVVNSKKEYNDLTDIYVKIANDSIFYYRGDSTVSKKNMPLGDKSLKILLTINNHPYSYTMHLKTGRYLFISKHQYYYNVYFNQFKKPVTL